jgi:Flp pilus assembly protein TadG
MRDLMTGLSRPVLRLLRRDDRGAVGVLVAVLIGGGVLLGMGAMVVDVGQLYSERAQLQNGADAGALGVAKTCAAGSCVTTAAQSYANLNAHDGTSAVDLVCGMGGLAACPASTGKIYDCPAAPAGGQKYVDVHTSTLTTSGSTLLPPSFARTLLGMSSYGGSTVKACAQAEWGPPSTATTIAFTISACEWDNATQNGTVFAPPPPAVPPPGYNPYDQVIALHAGSTSGACAANPADADAPGAFGWVDDPLKNCTVTIVNNQYGTSPGTSGNDCSSVLPNAAKPPPNETVVYVPVYSSVAMQGNNTIYTLKGFAAFVITGYTSLPSIGTSTDWDLPGTPAQELKKQKDLCQTVSGGNGSSPDCIDGYFTKGLIPSGGTVGTGPDLGADIFTLSG